MWIDVKERLPTHNQVVLVKTPYDHFQNTHHYDAIKNEFIRWSESSMREKKTKGVTHWYDGIPSVSFDLPKKTLAIRNDV